MTNGKDYTVGLLKFSVDDQKYIDKWAPYDFKVEIQKRPADSFIIKNGVKISQNQTPPRGIGNETTSQYNLTISCARIPQQIPSTGKGSGGGRILTTAFICNATEVGLAIDGFNEAIVAAEKIAKETDLPNMNVILPRATAAKMQSNQQWSLQISGPDKNIRLITNGESFISYSFAISDLPYWIDYLKSLKPDKIIQNYESAVNLAN